MISKILKGLAVMTVLIVEVPKVLNDGVVTVEELVDFFKKICAAGGWKTHLTVPDTVVSEILLVEGAEDKLSDVDRLKMINPVRGT